MSTKDTGDTSEPLAVVTSGTKGTKCIRWYVTGESGVTPAGHPIHLLGYGRQASGSKSLRQPVQEGSGNAGHI